MKLVTYRSSDSVRPAALLRSGDLLDLRQALAAESDEPLWNIAELLGRGPDAMSAAGAVVAAADENPSDARERGWILAAADIRLAAPTGHNPLFVTAGGLYPEHLSEMGLAEPANIQLSSAIRAGNALIGSGDEIRLPAAAPDMVDWEGEFALVIGAPCYRADVSDAAQYIGGYTIYNDISARDHTPQVVEEMQQPGGPSFRMMMLNLLYKEFPTFSPLGPCIVTPDEVDAERLVLQTTLNGQVVQDHRVLEARFGLDEVIAHVSESYQLMPGDVITLGTSKGVGHGQHPPRYLRAGDEIAVTIDGIGTLRNPIVNAD